MFPLRFICRNVIKIYRVLVSSKTFVTQKKKKNLARLENNDINNKSAVVKHVFSKKHHMNWNNSKILAKQADYIKRRFLESFFIHFNNDAFIDKTICFYPNAYYNLKF